MNRRTFLLGLGVAAASGLPVARVPGLAAMTKPLTYGDLRPSLATRTMLAEFESVLSLRRFGAIRAIAAAAPSGVIRFRRPVPFGPRP